MKKIIFALSILFAVASCSKSGLQPETPIVPEKFNYTNSITVNNIVLPILEVTVDADDEGITLNVAAGKLLSSNTTQDEGRTIVTDKFDACVFNFGIKWSDIKETIEDTNYDLVDIEYRNCTFTTFITEFSSYCLTKPVEPDIACDLGKSVKYYFAEITRGRLGNEDAVYEFYVSVKDYKGNTFEMSYQGPDIEFTGWNN